MDAKSRFRPVSISFATRVKDESGCWQETTINTSGYEDTENPDPSFFVLRERPSESDGIAILRLLITNLTYFD
jgi:hypothetical protein